MAGVHLFEYTRYLKADRPDACYYSFGFCGFGDQMSLRGKSLTVLTPMYGGNLTVNYHTSFTKLVGLCKESGIPVDVRNIFNESLVSRARNNLADQYLKDCPNTFALLVDADIGFEATDILAMMEHDKDILGVPCSKKSIRFDRIQNAIIHRVLQWAHNNPACMNGNNPAALRDTFLESGLAFTTNQLSDIGGDFVVNFPLERVMDFLERGKPFELDTPEIVKHAGTGLLMIKKEVFTNFRKAYPDRWYMSKDQVCYPGPIHDYFKVGVNPETREYDSEDYWFIHDCIAIGYKAHMLLSVKTTHMGTHTFIGDVPAALACAGTIF